MIKVEKIQKSYGSSIILSDVSFSISRGQKVALIGNNGTGKTTLLKILAGLEEYDSGKIEIEPDACIGYLPQDTSLSGKESIIEYLRDVSGISVLEKGMAELIESLDNPEKAAVYGELNSKYEYLDGYSFDRRAELMLAGFGLENIGTDRSLADLSSGQKSKVVLAGILLKGVDLLLLDEPTNNLDLPALIWLEDFLQKSEAACLVVSHDRKFLDRVIRKIFELDWYNHTMSVTNGTYSNFLDNMAKRLISQKEEYRLQQEEIERLSERAREQKASASKGAKWHGNDNDKFLKGFKRDQSAKSSKVAKSIEKRIEQMDKVEKPIERRPFEILIDAKVDSKSLDIRIFDLIAGYPNGFTVGPFSLNINFGERVGILGLNGSGKSTLLKTLACAMKPISGKIEIGSGAIIGNMMQEHESLPREKTPLEFFLQKTKWELKDAYAKLSKFSFSESQVNLPIVSLSPGGRARLLLAIFSAQSVNILFLDEPTNHLDLEALEALEETLKNYQGTVLLVSHDRYFIEKTMLSATYLLEDGGLSKIPDYDKYIKLAEERARKLINVL